MEDQNFQARWKLWALKVHEAMLRVANNVSKPFVWVSNRVNQTSYFLTH